MRIAWMVIWAISLGAASGQSSAWTRPPGMPSTGRWQQVVDDKTGSNWRTYKDLDTGQTVSLNPKQSEVVRTSDGRYEAVQIEGRASGSQDGFATDNGVPSSLAGKVTDVRDDTTGNNFVKKKLGADGQAVGYDQRTGELVVGNNGQLEAVIREPQTTGSGAWSNPNAPISNSSSGGAGSPFSGGNAGSVNKSGSSSWARGPLDKDGNPVSTSSNISSNNPSSDSSSAQVQQAPTPEQKHVIRTEYVPGYSGPGHTGGYVNEPGYTIYHWSDGSRTTSP